MAGVQQIILPNVDDILTAHDFILKTTGGKPGIRDENVMEGAIQRPVTYMQYRECTIHVVCALLLDSLARNHGFVEGNKRTALMSVILTYATNNIHLAYDKEMNKQFEELALKVVQQKPSIDEIASELEQLATRFKASSFKVFVDKLTSFFGA